MSLVHYLCRQVAEEETILYPVVNTTVDGKVRGAYMWMFKY